ncbi:MAG: type IV pilus modification PilV family protein [Fimbriiglobus sp.]
MILRSTPNRPGLSLLEVLVAMTIFLISLAAIASLVDFGADRSMAASMTTLGTRLAQSKLAEIEAGAIPPNTSETGTFEDEPDWSYSLEPGTELAANTYPVTIRVSREVAGRKYEVVLTQIIFDPAQQGKAAAATKPEPSTTGGM